MGGLINVIFKKYPKMKYTSKSKNKPMLNMLYIYIYMLCDVKKIPKYATYTSIPINLLQIWI